jgi:hypothetical protein
MSPCTPTTTTPSRRKDWQSKSRSHVSRSLTVAKGDVDLSPLLSLGGTVNKIRLLLDPKRSGEWSDAKGSVGLTLSIKPTWVDRSDENAESTMSEQVVNTLLLCGCLATKFTRYNMVCCNESDVLQLLYSALWMFQVYENDSSEEEGPE